MTTGRNSEPLVSAVVPAFNAQAFIAEAVAGILGQRGAPPFEIIVAPDDDASYAEVRTLASSRILRVLPPNGHHGIAQARNRAIAAARGALIALCDADDLWPDNYLKELTPPALAHGAACANTRYTTWDGETFRTPDLHGPRLGLQTYARCLASIRPLWKKSLGIGFQSTFAEDVLHMLHLTAIRNDGIPLVDTTHYQLRERCGSASFAGIEREREILAAYTPLIDHARNSPAAIGLEALPEARRDIIVESLAFWRFANAAYLDTGCRQSFIRFVAGHEADLWQQFQAGHR